jgi:hypothetical protein
MGAGVFVPASPAGTITWSGTAGDSNWFTTNNWLGNVVPGATNDVLISTNGGTNAVILLTNNATVLSLDITNRTLQFRGWSPEATPSNVLTASNIVIRNGAKFTHQTNSAATTNGSGGWDPDNGIFIRCTNLTVQAGGEINADRCGYRGGAVTNSGCGPGGGYFVGVRGGGGGYGGKGGAGGQAGAYGGATYGVTTNPASPGSGGGGGGANPGGNGGGYIRVIAKGTVTADGLISANGTNGAYRAGGGSGGGIYIQCGNLTGSGTIRADGGDRGNEGGGGGGGRIALYATNAIGFNGQLSAKNALGTYDFPDHDRLAGLPGTIYLSDWGILPGYLTNGGAGRFLAGTGVASSVTISNYTLFLEWGWETNRLRAGIVTVKNTGKIMHVWNMATNEPWTPNAGVFIECSNLTVEAGGEINADGLGYAGGEESTNGYGPGRGFSNGSRGAGGGYGGAGNKGYLPAGGVTYGIASNPTNPGSGGGGGFSTIGYPGGNGGGYIRVVAAGTVTVDGLISAKGTNALSRAGGGAGGGIFIQCGNLTGSGTIRADGGNGGGEGGSGGGGRIALYVRKAPFYTSGNLLATAPPGGGGGTYPGDPGTIYSDFKPRGTMFSTW